MKIVLVTLKVDMGHTSRDGLDRVVLLTAGLNGLGLMYQLHLQRDDPLAARVVVQGQEDKLAALLRRYHAILTVDKTAAQEGPEEPAPFEGGLR